MTKEELKATLDTAWFEERNDLIEESFEEYYIDVTEYSVEPSDEYFASIVNANVAEHYAESILSSYY
ncbi:hypothetical protein IR083_22990 [Dysgonomonas sp. GY75]|uniref:hypothetical protein n=1 Tax=Dysgonomonas sp. GY75 TaxID=2780419 RepID=UPI0018834EF8|nr:hypothetical protein [Dysgonomonas sp. GY75]MBF0651688.1 hypothetical protein [Dysgonomonas sp. GY75]